MSITIHFCVSELIFGVLFFVSRTLDTKFLVRKKGQVFRLFLERGSTAGNHPGA